MSPLRILLADDHAILREGLALLINAEPDMAVVAEAGYGREAVQLAQRHQPDVVVLDVSMPDLSGADAAQQVRQSCPAVRVLALTRHGDQGYLRRLLRAGATGYVVKKSPAGALLGAIRTVAGGGTYIDPAVAGALVAHALGRGGTGAGPTGRTKPDLTEREEQVLRMIAWGQSNKEIAERLGISVKTVEFYKAAAVEKLQLRGRTDIIRYALAHRWLSDDLGPE
ncbi:response regulator [Caldimonas brevitalea]|uniref:Two component transcriptional regulator, LuxR family n=1 Tax=Caldimonas brevitalea TaxID=413882 RepID=A0A0G3BJN6_9BURK|nr:response regulator transcription factor [Caldimonas brevitalea]AKJ27596.1 two component transcriptional regulator, LuxR family [Caldimonas brevitalea]